jgi:hypothetical protein
MIVCWETLQISAASPVVKTVFIVKSSINGLLNAVGTLKAIPISPLIHLRYLNIDQGILQLELHWEQDFGLKRLRMDGLEGGLQYRLF